jgi:hypothetical protein
LAFPVGFVDKSKDVVTDRTRFMNDLDAENWSLCKLTTQLKVESWAKRLQMTLMCSMECRLGYKLLEESLMMKISSRF